MNGFFLWIENEENLNPIQLASEAYHRLIRIHPFIDCNDQSAKLLVNMILIMKGYPPAIINKNDHLKFINRLAKNDDAPYLELIENGVNYSLDICLKAVNNENIEEKEKFLKIGELAKIVQEQNSTIRYWTKAGLLEVAQVTNAGYQIYAYDMVKRIKKIKKLQEKRFTLLEIKNKLAIY